MDKATRERRRIYAQSRINVDESWALGFDKSKLDVHAISVIANGDPVKAARLARRMLSEECAQCGKCTG